MIPVRRLLITLPILALPLALAVSNASAARHHARHAAAYRAHRATQAMTATYQVVARPHAPRRLRAARASAGHFAQSLDRSQSSGRSLMLGS